MMLDNDVDLIACQLDATYTASRQTGDRALVFCASIDFCTPLTDRLRDVYPFASVLASRDCFRDSPAGEGIGRTAELRPARAARRTLVLSRLA